MGLAASFILNTLSLSLINSVYQIQESGQLSIQEGSLYNGLGLRHCGSVTPQKGELSAMWSELHHRCLCELYI